jgi:hypothetical protein
VPVAAKGPRGAAAARDLAPCEAFHSERPLLCVAAAATMGGRAAAAGRDLLCRCCLAPLGDPAEHVSALFPALLGLGVELGGAKMLCAVEGRGCERCGARFCGAEGCQAERRTGHAIVCAGLEGVRRSWPQLATSPRFRMFAQALGRPGTDDAVAALCQPALPDDENTTAVEAMEAALAAPLACLRRCALHNAAAAMAPAAQGKRLVEVQSRIAARCTPEGYRSFERRVATNAHGLRISSPAGAALAFLVEILPSLDEVAQRTIAAAVASVSGELPTYCVTAVFAQASSLNHSCDPSVEVVSGGARAEMQLRATRALRRGSELSIAYVLRRHAEGGQRVRTELYERYGFSCECSVCLQEMNTGCIDRCITSSKR